MILDDFSRRDRYHALHPGLAEAFAFAAAHDLAILSPGRHTIDGDRLFVSIDHVAGRGRAGARLESHRRYIDIQLTIDGHEEIGWRALADCRAPSPPFDQTRDIGFYDDVPESWLAVPAGKFAIFFPDDAHAPLAGIGPLRKAIFKVAV